MIKTPYFLLDERKFRANLELIKSIEDRAGIKILLALKAFSFWRAFDIVRDYFTEGAASSYNEARLIHEELGKKAHTFSTIFYDDDFDELCSHSSHLIFNSVSQLVKFKDRALDNGMSIGLRVNPGWSDVATEIYNPASPYSRLGVSSDAMGGFWDDSIEGLHFHVLCESNSYSFEKAFQSFEERFEPYLHKVKWLNFGGGHLMTSAGYDIDHLIATLKGIKEKYSVDIILEPGAAFVWQIGTLLSRVEDIVQNGNTKIACLDVSFTCHMPDTLEMPYQPLVDLGVDSSDYPYILGGTSCLAGDYIPGYYMERPLVVGDILEFQDMIQYTLVKTTFFNGVKHPSVYLKTIDGEMKLLKSFDYQDFKQKS